MFAHTAELPIHVWYKRRRWPAALLVTSLFAALLIAAMLPTRARWTIASAGAPPATPPTPAGIVTSFGYRASHNMRYHAEIISVSSLSESESQRWKVRLTRRDHQPLANAHLGVEASMPETGVRSPIRPSASFIGADRYVVDGVYLPQKGWWNLALVIEGRDGTDSVAFNLILR